jgi:alpha-D-ribose 1-methylphosphonate 5-triphosphate synthase subunit PhnL
LFQNFVVSFLRIIPVCFWLDILMEADLQRGGGSKAGASGITRDLYNSCLPLAAEFDATKEAEKEASCQA